MGRIADLRKKEAEGTLSEEEKKELQELLDEAQASSDTKDDDSTVAEGDDDDDVEEAASKLAESVSSVIDEKLAPLMKAFENHDVKDVKSVKTPVVINTALGQKTVDELSEEKIVISGRKFKGKEHHTVSGRTGEFVKALIQSDQQKLQLLSEGVGADGGFLVPEDWELQIVEDRRDATVMRQLADVIPMTSDTLHLGSVDTRPKAQWRAEAAVKHTSTVQFGETVLTPYSLASIVGLSNELAGDSRVGGSIIQLVTGYIVQAIAEEEDKAFFTGNGSGKPTGIDNYSLAALDAATQSDAERADVIVKTWRRLGQGYRNNAVWVANALTYELTDGLKDTNGQFLLRGLEGAPAPTLRGRPTFEQNDIAVGKLFFGDFSYYKIGDREGISVKVSDEATVAGSSAFEKNLTYIRVEERVDGELTLTQPIREVTLV